MYQRWPKSEIDLSLNQNIPKTKTFFARKFQNNMQNFSENLSLLRGGVRGAGRPFL